jgi:ribosomal protein L29
VAGGFAAIGAVAAFAVSVKELFAVSVKELEEEVAEERAEQADAKVVMATAQAMMQAPLSLLGAAELEQKHNEFQPADCPSSDAFRQFEVFAKGGSGSVVVSG